LSFVSVQTSPQLCQQVVNAEVFEKDLQAQTLPEFSLYIPNNRSNGHDTGVAFADAWLAKTFGKIFDNLQNYPHTLFVLTFDEDSYHGNNQIYTLLLGAGVRAGSHSEKRYDHYSLLRTIEAIFSLPTLGKKDQTAIAIDDVWKEI
jgi:acid phosphatase